MTDKTAFGDRMKLYERMEAGRRFMPRLPICVRLDGKGFSKWTRGLARPYDPRLSALMEHVATRLVEETQAVIGYTQSDEISLVFYTADPKAQVFFDGRIQKMTSVLAAMTTAVSPIPKCPILWWMATRAPSISASKRPGWATAWSACG